MASAAARVNCDNTATTHPYYCHRCTRTVIIYLDSLSSPICPICHDGFLEEVVIGNADPNLDLNAQSYQSNTSTHSLNNAHRVSGGFNIQEYVRNVGAQGPPLARIQFVFGDYPRPSRSIDPGSEVIIDHFAEYDPGESVPTPASRVAIERLTDVIVDEDILRSEMKSCAICQERFEKDTSLKQMPCTHLFHSQCLVAWLGTGNSCPLCRYKLEENDPLEQNLAMDNSGSGGGVDALRAAVGESIADRVRMRRRGDI